ncbi:hypothetical protein KW491_06430 [Vibrio fluvialis]|nr:hypothetical protein [Vibrio fluvialis]MBY8063602.1 hypothetical protein [Vibrio fluvialis]MBY8132206.1 hypothetical protein [Vibrio fluvialis]
MPSIQVTGVLEDPITGVESDAEIRIISKINYGQTTKNSDSITVLSSSGVYDFQLVYGKHLIAVKSKDSQVFTNIGTVVVGEGSPSPIDIITLIATSSEEPDPILITQLQLIAAEASESAAKASVDADRAESAASSAESNATLTEAARQEVEGNAAIVQSNADTVASSALAVEDARQEVESNAAAVQSNADAVSLAATEVESDRQEVATNTSLSAGYAQSASDDADRAEAAALTASSGVIDRGSWDASAGNFPTPTLTPEERTDWYRISVAGVMSDGIQPDIDASIGDNLYWDKENDVWYKIDNTDKVNSVNGKEGDVVLDASDFDDIYSKNEVDNALLSKANSSDVYLKTDTYSQTEIDDALSSKANSSDVYQKTETYSQTEVDSALSNLAQSISYQVPAYDLSTIYSYGDVVYKTIGGVKKFFQWYSNMESLAGKDPELDENRQTGWVDDTKPFYWTPLKGSRPGTPLWPWMSMTFPEGTLNVVGNSVPVAVFWRLAEAFPEFINGDYIDFPETGGEFFRVLDQGRGIDIGRAFNSSQLSQNLSHNHNWYQGGAPVGSVAGTTASAGDSGSIQVPTDSEGGNEARPRNLAFPILVEV